MAISFRAIKTGEPKIDRIISEIEAVVRQVNDALNGTVGLWQGSLSATSKTIHHGLGRVPIGWLELRKDANAVVYEDTAVKATATTITLKASGAVNVTLRFV